MVEFGVTEFFQLMNNEGGAHVEMYYNPISNSEAVIETYVTANDGSYPRTQTGAAVGPRMLGDIYLAFTGGTGGANFNCEIDNLSIGTPCCEAADSVVVNGPTEANTGDVVDITAVFTGADGAVTYSWLLVTQGGGVAIPGSGDTIQFLLENDGLVQIQVTASDEACNNEVTATLDIQVTSTGGLVKPMDMNQDGAQDISDAVAILSHLFLGGAAPYCGDLSIEDPANVALLDANGDGGIDISDPVSLLAWLFLGGPPPANCTDGTCPCFRIVNCPDVCQ